MRRSSALTPTGPWAPAPAQAALGDVGAGSCLPREEPEPRPGVCLLPEPLGTQGGSWEPASVWNVMKEPLSLCRGSVPKSPREEEEAWGKSPGAGRVVCACVCMPMCMCVCRDRGSWRELGLVLLPPRGHTSGQRHVPSVCGALTIGPDRGSGGCCGVGPRPVSEHDAQALGSCTHTLGGETGRELSSRGTGQRWGGGRQKGPAGAMGRGRAGVPWKQPQGAEELCFRAARAPPGQVAWCFPPATWKAMTKATSRKCSAG